MISEVKNWNRKTNEKIRKETDIERKGCKEADG